MNAFTPIDRYGAGIGSLTIYLQQEGFRRIPMWTLSGEQINDWLQGKVGFVVNSDHSILIEATIAKENETDIAIDDISIVNGYCTIYPILAQPNTSFTISTQRTTTTTTLGVTTSLISTSITNTSSNPLSTPITTSRSTTNTWLPSSFLTPKTTVPTMLSSQLSTSVITPKPTITTSSTSLPSTLGNFAIVIVILILSVLV
ncbi:unnamed protein product [Rotaria sp. Silwood2]|nr:unnamed protein product [Rotaria sp. Silwood2]CAF2852015.1 unnamed protein product [Rotaria sp. Silwood2]CAF3459824.1 unnamed protein product [Rotaria sp. Silwood2]CAF4405870.1 unnamed protein product [Rotaria sp. Silwood2]CAF4517214.1 unnamed protein product [Rotaria sp. Silwood2]